MSWEWISLQTVNSICHCEESIWIIKGLWVQCFYQVSLAGTIYESIWTSMKVMESPWNFVKYPSDKEIIPKCSAWLQNVKFREKRISLKNRRIDKVHLWHKWLIEGRWLVFDPVGVSSVVPRVTWKIAFTLPKINILGSIFFTNIPF